MSVKPTDRFQQPFAFASDSLMSERVRTFDWAATPLGPVEGWPQSLRLAVGICLSSHFPMFVWWGPDLINIYNDAYIPVLGQRHPDALGRSAREVWRELWPVVGPQAEAVLSRGEATWNERVLLVMERHGYAEDTYFTWSYSPIPDDHGRIGGVFCACTEETQRMQAEAERDQLLVQVESERSRLADVFAQSPAFIAVLREPSHIFEFANDPYLQLIGRREIIGKTVEEALPEVREQGFIDLLDQVYSSGVAQSGQGTRVRLQRHVDQPREERIVDFVYQPMRNAAGEVSGVIAHGIDVTERVQVEEALRLSESRYRALFDSIDAGFCVLEMMFDEDNRPIDYRFLDMNAAFERHTGLRNAKGKRARELVPNLEQHWFDTYGSVALTGEAVRFVNEAKAMDARWFDVYAFRIDDPQDRRVGLLFNDITARRHADEMLRQRTEELAAANAAKDEFLAILSHELRTPLTPVLLTLSLMESNPALTPELREDVESIRRNVELESRLISDLLDLTRIAKGKLQLDEQDVDLHLLVRAAVDICQREASARLTVELGAKRHTVRGDSTRLQQVFWNLINNAIKFTPPQGTITVRTSNAGDDIIRVEVTDTGVGISPAVLPRLFNAFEQGDVRMIRQQAGLGLGLAISRRLVEAHGGVVAAHSEGRGRGATFTVDLPVVDYFAPQPMEADPASAGPTVTTLAVLLVEDHPPTLAVLMRLLRQLGHRVTGVTSVSAALAAVRQETFDALISDLGLPDSSGLDLMRQLGGAFAGRAIALTGYGMESDIAASREAGFAEHLTKPVDLPALQEALERVARRAGA